MEAKMKSMLGYITLACVVIAGGAFAEDSKVTGKTLKYYAEIYGYSYDEPNVMTKKSSLPFIGVGVQDFGQAGRSGLIYEARLAFGETDYSSNGTGTVDGTPTYVYSGEVSWLKSWKEYNIFAGLGYRYLFDDGGGVQSSTGHWGYDRKSEYLYLPVGIINYLQDTGYFKAQYNHLISGTQTSYLGYLSANDYDLVHDQESGYGYSLEYAPNENYSIFLRHWKIDDSKIVAYRGTNTLEPVNDTVELGVKVLF
jgi:hypothetical protein